MENIEWKKVFYNELETNIEVTKCGKVKKIRVDWMTYKTPIGEIDFTKLKLRLNGYYQVGIQIKGLKAKTIMVHQLIASAFLDYKFKGYEIVVDHIDSNKLNNHVKNLKIVTQRENSSKEKTLKSGLPVGVYFFKKTNKYYSKIFLNNKSNFLGYYFTIEEASNAYQNKLKTIKIN
jgi:hypothetical protein